MTLFVTVGAVWLWTAIVNSRLLALFIKKYPEEAKRELPWAVSHSRHPDNVTFFFRKKARPLLEADGELWRLRQQFKLAIILSAVVPMTGFGAIAAVAFAILLRG